MSYTVQDGKIDGKGVLYWHKQYIDRRDRVRQLLAKVTDLRVWLRTYKILRDAHKNHRRTLLAENELLREYISAVLEEALPVIHIHQVRNINHQAQFPRCKKAWANIPENVRVILEANIPESVGLIREMKPSDDGELLEMEELERKIECTCSVMARHSDDCPMAGQENRNDRRTIV